MFRAVQTIWMRGIQHLNNSNINKTEFRPTEFTDMHRGWKGGGGIW